MLRLKGTKEVLNVIIKVQDIRRILKSSSQHWRRNE